MKAKARSFATWMAVFQAIVAAAWLSVGVGELRARGMSPFARHECGIRSWYPWRSGDLIPESELVMEFNDLDFQASNEGRKAIKEWLAHFSPPDAIGGYCK